MITPLRFWYLAAIASLSTSLGHIRFPDMMPMNRVAATAPADSVTGEWKANGSDPGWNGRFVLHLILQQVGDSVSGTYQFELDRATVVPPADVFGRFRAGRLELVDRADRFWLSVTLRRDHLDGRLAGGSRNRASAVSISFERVDRR
jgi:hypothetical protein